ncbi:MAG: hypothetical protein RR630_02745 [Coprobacillus sp.]
MKKANYYFTLCLVLFTTVFSFINMFQIVKVSTNVIQIVFTNLLPSLLPFMILISLCLSLGLFQIFSYLIQFIFSPIFHLTPHMSSLYFVSFFCGYPTNAKIIKESYELGYINIHQLQHLLSIASFSSISFIFISLHLPLNQAILIYICHITPSIIKALCYKEDYKFIHLNETIYQLKHPHMSFVSALKQSILSSLTAFIFILGYMLVFQFIGYSLHFFIKNTFILAIIQGMLEFSSGSIQILQFQSFFVLPVVCFYLSFSGLSVLMQVDNILEGVPYSFKKYLKSRLIHGVCSFLLCCFVLLII